MVRRQPADDDEPFGVRLDEVDEEATEWLFENWLVLGELNGIGGQKGVGKGALSVAFAAMVTRGTLPGALYGKPANVAIAWSEDPSASRDLKPRIMAQGGDPKRVFGLRRFLIGEDTINELTDFVVRKKVRFVVIDHLQDYVPQHIDVMTDEVRPYLVLLTQLANNSGATVLEVMHETNKKDTSVKRGKSKGQSQPKRKSQPMNASAFLNVPRTYLSIHKVRGTQYDREVERAECNAPADPVEPLAFRTEKVNVGTDGKGRKIMAIRAVWLGDMSEEWIGRDAESNGWTQLDEGKAFLERFLRTGPREVSDIMDRATAKDLSTATVKRAADALNLKKERRGFPAKGIWSLP